LSGRVTIMSKKPQEARSPVIPLSFSNWTKLWEIDRDRVEGQSKVNTVVETVMGKEEGTWPVQLISLRKNIILAFHFTKYVLKSYFFLCICFLINLSVLYKPILCTDFYLKYTWYISVPRVLLPIWCFYSKYPLLSTTDFYPFDHPPIHPCRLITVCTVRYSVWYILYIRHMFIIS
jgi:hypothetical protein